MSGHDPQGTYRIMAFRDFVPDRLRFFILLFFAVSFQFSGGIYLSSVSQLVGGKAILQEDVMMAGYASFVGMVMSFPLLFRIKLRFNSRRILITCMLLVATANVITMYSQNIFVLVFTCFIAGAVRMVGMFECMSTLQLKITPTRNMVVFFCVVYTLVVGCIQLSGLTAVYLDYFFSWKYMHVFMVGLLAFNAACAYFLMRDVRTMKKLPLYGIDWTGFLLWSVFQLSAIFVFQYGKHLDWFDSADVCAAALISLFSLGLSLWNMYRAKRPFLSPRLFYYRNFKSGLFLTAAMVFLLATPNVIQGALTGAVLHYDSLNNASLNWLVLCGVAAGILLCWYTMAVIRMRIKYIIFFGFACLVGYQLIIYFIIDPRTSIEMFYLPSVLKGIGYAVLYVSLTLYPTERIPFTHFFQSLSVIGFVRNGIVAVIAASLVSNGLNYLVHKNAMLLSMELDAVNPLAAPLPAGELYGELMRQSMLVSMKEIMGWFVIGGLITLLFILIMRYIRPVIRIMPKMKYFRRYIRGQYRLREIK